MKGFAPLTLDELCGAVEEMEPNGVARPLNGDQKKMVALLVAIGEPIEQVATKLQLHFPLCRDYVHSPVGIDQVLRIQSSMFADPVTRVKKLTHMALDAQARLLVSAKGEAVVAKVAQDILDRSMGKATQVIENRNLNINVTDTASADRALAAQMERLARLEETQKKLLEARREVAS